MGRFMNTLGRARRGPLGADPFADSDVVRRVPASVLTAGSDG